MDYWDYIALAPEICSGKPVVKGTRVLVEIVIGAFAGGMTVAEVCEDYTLTDEQVRACVAYARDVVSFPRSHLD